MKTVRSVCSFVFVLVAACVTRAETTINVNTFNDVVDGGDAYTSLREAINTANAGSDDYRINLSAGGQFWPYNLTGNGDNANAMGDLDIYTPGRTVTITIGLGEAWIVSAYADRLLHVRAGTVVVERVTFSHGQAVDDGSGGANGSGGAILVESGASLTLNNVTIWDCHVRTGNTFGGAVFVGPSASLTIEGGALTANSSWATDGTDGELPSSAGTAGYNAIGGALCIYGIATVNRCTISGNYAHGGDGGDGHQGSGGISPTVGGAGGAGGGAMGAWAAVLGGLLKGDCVVLSGNSVIGGAGGAGGDGAINSLGTFSSDGGPGGAGGNVYDSPRGFYVLTPAIAQLGGYGDRSYTCGAGGAGGIAPTGLYIVAGSDGADGADGTYYTCDLKCLDVRSYLSLDQAGTFSSFIGDVTTTLQDTNGTMLCYDISRSSSSASHNSGLCHTYTAAVVRVDPPPYGYRRGAKPPSAFDRDSNVSDVQTASAALNNPLCNGPICVSPSGGNQYPYCSWTYASRTITNALAAAPEGSLVLLDTATHTQTCTVVLTNTLTLRGDTNHPETVIVRQAALDVPCFQMAHSNALLEGITICGVRSTENGGGVTFAGGGKVNRCIITDNQAANGAGVNLEVEGGGLVTHTVIRGNAASGAGGGAVCTQGGILRNCLIVDNAAGDSCGGVFLDYNGMVESCTVNGNAATNAQGGIGVGSSSTIRNTIVWGNTAPSDPEWSVWSSVTAYNNCTRPLLGSDSTTNDPLFADEAAGDLRLLGDSPCINAGLSQSWMSGASDIRGRPRITGSAPDIGAYEQGLFTITASVANTNGVMTPTGAVTCLEFDDSSFVFTPALYCGIRDVLVDGVSIGETNAYTFEGVDANHTLVVVFQNIIHVSHDGTAMPPYVDWATAARTLEQATSAVSSAGLILVTNGTFVLTNEVVLAAPITVRGFNGATNTTLAGQGLVRFLRLTHADAVLENVTLTGGVATNIDLDEDGAVVLDLGGTVQDCVVTGNAHTAVLMDSGGRTRRCRFADNTVGAVLSEGGTLEDSVFTDHRQCAIMISGGGLAVGCSAVSNSGIGVVVVGGAVSNCLIAYNVTTQSVAGVLAYNPQGFYNCVIAGNSCSSNTGGFIGYYARLANCTIADNYGSNCGGAFLYDCDLVNCIVYSNRNNGMTAQRNIHDYGANSFLNCCTVPGLGTACVTSPPAFADSVAGDYSLTPGSPCIDAGTWADIVPRKDYLGAARPLDGDSNGVAVVDIGAYEFVHPNVDTDGDGIPDKWEVARRLCPTNAADAPIDTDDDDDINTVEYIADTDPWNVNDYFCIREVRRTNLCAVGFVGSTQRIYTLYACTNIDQDAWQSVNGCVNQWGSGNNTILVDTNAAQHMSYTIGVSLP